MTFNLFLSFPPPTYTHTYTHTPTFINKHTYIQVYTQIHTCIHIHTHTHTHTRIYTYTHTNLFAPHAQINTYTHTNLFAPHTGIDDLETQHTCARGFLALTSICNTKNDVLQSRTVIRSLYSLLKSEAAETRIIAGMAVCNLLACEESQMAAIHAGGE